MSRTKKKEKGKKNEDDNRHGNNKQQTELFEIGCVHSYSKYVYNILMIFFRSPFFFFISRLHPPAILSSFSKEQNLKQNKIEGKKK